jgi:phenylpyruvate tautomerase PptA (4-oxalocrotonate tautomerase family)
VPHYQFIIEAGSESSRRKHEIAAAFTEIHTRITGAPALYVNCSFIEVEPGSIFAAGEQTKYGRMTGLIRRGRTEEVKRRLLTELAQAWSSISGEPLDRITLFMHEIPGYQAWEDGELAREASEDHLLTSEQ